MYHIPLFLLCVVLVLSFLHLGYGEKVKREK